MLSLLDKSEAEALWERNKDLLRKLYLEENKTLDEVKNVMAGSYQFEATNAQYERKFKHWKFRKNLKKQDWVAVGHVVSERKRDGKESEVLLDGFRLQPKKVRKEISRNTFPSVLSHHVQEPTPGALEGIVIRTPLASPSPTVATREISHVSPGASAPTRLGCDLPHDPRLATSLWNPEGGLSQVPAAQEKELSWCEDLPIFTFEQVYNSEVTRIMGVPSPRVSERITMNASAFFDIAPLNLPPHFDAALEHVEGMILNVLTNAPSYASAVGAILSQTSTSLSEVPEVYQGGAIPATETFGQVTRQARTAELVKVIVFLLSNNLLDPDANTGKMILSWLRATGNIKFVERLLNSKGPTFESLAEKLLRIAINAEDVSIVQMLLQARLDPNELTHVDRFGRKTSPLDWALETENVELISCLLNAGARLERQDPLPMKNTRLVDAAYKRKSKIVKLLLDAGEDANCRDTDGFTALHAALCNKAGLAEKDEDVFLIIALLLDARADVNLKTKYSRRGPPDCAEKTTALDLAVASGQMDTVKLLLHYGAKITENALYDAIGNCYNDLVQFLLNSGEIVDGEAKCKNAELKMAVCNRDVDLAKSLLQSGANINDQTWARRRAMSPLQEASYIGHFEMVKILLDAGADANAIPGHHKPWCESGGRLSALQAAVLGGFTELVTVLLNAGADADGGAEGGSHPDGYDSKTATPIEMATKDRNAPLVMVLLEAGANVNRVTGRGAAKPTLQCAVEWGDLDIIQALLDAGAHTDLGPSGDGENPFNAAIESGDMSRIQLLLDHGAEINSPLSKMNGRSALATAASKNDKSLVEFLLNIGADPIDSIALLLAVDKVNGEAVDVEIVQILLAAWRRTYSPSGKNYGQDALHRAVALQDAQLVRLLLDAGVDVNSYVPSYGHFVRGRNQRRDGETAFATAIRTANDEDLRIIQLLLQAGANPNSRVTSWPNQTAFLFAISQSKICLTRLLIEAGANVNMPAIRGLRRTPLQEAAEVGNTELVQLLLNAGADVHAPPAVCAGVTALQAAAIGGHLNIAITLLSRGADVNAAPAKSNGRTALEGAAEYGRIDMLQLLLNAGAKIEGEGHAQYKQAVEFATKNGHNAARRILESNRAQKCAVPDFCAIQQDEPLDAYLGSAGLGEFSFGSRDLEELEPLFGIDNLL